MRRTKNDAIFGPPCIFSVSNETSKLRFGKTKQHYARLEQFVTCNEHETVKQTLLNDGSRMIVIRNIETKDADN